MAFITSRPPGLRFFSASTTGFQTGVVSIIESRDSGAESVVSPAHDAPSSSANALSVSLLAKTNTLFSG